MSRVLGEGEPREVILKFRGTVPHDQRGDAYNAAVRVGAMYIAAGLADAASFRMPGEDKDDWVIKDPKTGEVLAVAPSGIVISRTDINEAIRP